METLKHPLWSEGTLLTQQHFQQWDTFLENSIIFRMKMLNHYLWGLSHLKIDESALSTGIFRIKECCALFPNGQMVTFNAAEHGELCLTLSNERHPITEVFLCTPLNSHIQGLSGYETQHDLYGFITLYESICDQYDYLREHEIAFAIPNLCLLDENQNRDQYAQIKIAEIKCLSSNQYQIESLFIPPIIHISISSALTDLLRRILNLLSAKIRFISEKKFFYTEIIPLLLLQALNQRFFILRTIAQQGSLHPWKLYVELVQLLGSLSAFLQSGDPIDLPIYDHNYLTSVFNNLEQQLQRMINQALPSNIVQLNFTQQNDSLYLIDSIDNQFFSSNYCFYLAVKTTDDDSQWINRFLQQIKITCQQDIQAAIGSAIPTIPLQHLQQPPHYLPIKSGYEYFLLSQQNEYFEHIAKAKNLALFVSHEFNESQFEMIVIKEE